jgi:thymidylate kinase
MKIFFIEGPDNTGKTTIVNELYNWLPNIQCNNVNIMHCKKPEGDTIKDQIAFQNNAYAELTNQLINWNDTNEYDAVIFDRCWYGEYIYGTMYRNRNKREVLDRIHNYEHMLLKSNNIELYFILLTTPSPEFLVKNDDGKSISNANIKLIKKEIELFNEIYDATIINDKAKVIVTKNPSEFRTKESIFSDILEKTCLNKTFYGN